MQVPHAFEQHGARDHLPLAPREEFQQLEFLGGEFDALAAARDGAAQQVDVEIAGGLGTRLGQILEAADNNWCIYITGSNTFMTDCVAEVGQGGIRIGPSSQQNRIENTRSDLHARHGWYIEGTRSQFSNCIALNCGLEGMHSGKTVGWPGWSLIAGGHNTFTNCRNHLETYKGNVSFGFQEFGDEPGKGGHRAINTLVGCTSFGHAIAPFETKSAGPVIGNNVHYAAESIGSGGMIPSICVCPSIALHGRARAGRAGRSLSPCGRPAGSPGRGPRR